MTPPAKPSAKPSRFDVLLPAALIALAGAAAYANSFSGPFVFDDAASVTDNQSIRHLSTAFWPDHGSGQTVEGRPILNLSLALNYAISGTQVWSYHLLNLLIHILAGLTLFGVVRRTLELWESSRFREKSEVGTGGSPVRSAPGTSTDGRAGKRVRDNALHLSLAIALIWTVHPLQTESVTYVVQRAESLMGLFFLLTFYCFIRATEVERVVLNELGHVGPNALGSRERERAVWYALSVAFFLLGIGTKEVIATALPLLFLYDSVFVSGSLAKAWRAHRGLWISLACCLMILAALIVSGGGNRNGTIGFGVGVSPIAHALTQPFALVTYLKLCVLPFPLVFDYGTFSAPHVRDFLPQTAVIIALLVLTIIAFKRAPALGFIGAWFFVILAPTSLVPEATQMIVEHRMYLPLAAVVALLALGVHRLLGRSSFSVLLIVAAVFGWMTFQRNETYRTEERIWRDTVVKSPNNERAHYSLGNALAQAGRMSESVTEYEAALQLRPDYPQAHNALGNVLDTAGQIPEAIAQYREAVLLKPDFADAHSNLGAALSTEGRTAEAIAQYEEALRLKPYIAEAHNNLAGALSVEGRNAEAIAQCEEALRLKPDYAEAHNNLANILSAEDRTSEAIAQYEEAARLKPDIAAIHFNLAIALLKAPGRTDEAAVHLRAVLRLQPDNEQARQILAQIGAPGP